MTEAFMLAGKRKNEFEEFGAPLSDAKANEARKISLENQMSNLKPLKQNQSVRHGLVLSDKKEFYVLLAEPKTIVPLCAQSPGQPGGAGLVPLEGKGCYGFDVGKTAKEGGFAAAISSTYTVNVHNPGEEGGELQMPFGGFYAKDGQYFQLRRDARIDKTDPRYNDGALQKDKGTPWTTVFGVKEDGTPQILNVQDFDGKKEGWNFWLECGQRIVENGEVPQRKLKENEQTRMAIFTTDDGKVGFAKSDFCSIEDFSKALIDMGAKDAVLIDGSNAGQMYARDNPGLKFGGVRIIEAENLDEFKKKASEKGWKLDRQLDGLQMPSGKRATLYDRELISTQNVAGLKQFAEILNRMGVEAKPDAIQRVWEGKQTTLDYESKDLLVEKEGDSVKFYRVDGTYKIEKKDGNIIAYKEDAMKLYSGRRTLGTAFGIAGENAELASQEQ